MTYIRKKTINGKDYYYLVEGIREGNKVRQRVVKYIGKKKPSKKEIKKL